MPKLNLSDVSQFVKDNIGEFHQKRLAKVNAISLADVLISKNPYLYKAKNVTTANEIIEGILSAYLSSSEEGIFGNWLERLAIFINDSVYYGRKGGIEGIDLDFDKDGKRYIVAIKSGPNWGNDSQIKRMVDNFNTARRRLTSSSRLVIICVNGCCYGRSNVRYEYKKNGDYFKYCGQRFWELISGEEELYTELIIPIGYEAEIKNQEFKESYGQLINRLTTQFLDVFCTQDYAIDWDKLVRYNSGTVISGQSKLNVVKKSK